MSPPDVANFELKAAKCCINAVLYYFSVWSTVMALKQILDLLLVLMEPIVWVLNVKLHLSNRFVSWILALQEKITPRKSTKRTEGCIFQTQSFSPLILFLTSIILSFSSSINPSSKEVCLLQ